jgi:uncharacterized protein
MGDESWKMASKFMSPETAEILSRRVQEHIREFDLKEYVFGLHGGEPLLMSPSKLDEIVINLRSAIESDVKVNFGIQTNAVLMTEEHISVIKKNNIKVSVSLDGLKDNHDRFRLTRNGGRSWEKTIAGIRMLQELAPENFIGLLCVIDIESDPLDTFDFMSSFNVDIDFLLPLRTHDNKPFYPPGKEKAYGLWYYSIYQEWVKGRNSHIDIRFLTNIITQLMGGEAIYEVMTYNPIGLLTISTDGDIEGLDCLKSIGKGVQVTGRNIRDTSLSEALELEVVRLRQNGIDGLNEKCRKCDYLKGCAGGYFPNRYSEERGFDNPSVYCEDLYWLLSKIESDLQKRITNEHAPA